jgi:tyrosyl-tRNA synthetase
VSILEELKWRGLYEDCTDVPIKSWERLTEEDDGKITKEEGGGGPNWESYRGILTREGITLYCGFDPTADSLHVGHLVPLLALRRFQLLNHRPIAVAGGATGSIGDPSWKAQERPLLTKEILERNVASIKIQLTKLLDFETKQNPARLVDNASWMAGISFLDFLRDIGKHFSVNQMIAKESIRSRMEDREAGISYAEFSYPLIQAFDFYVLARDFNCELQIGGSDQWGNITAGIDLCRKKLGKTAFGLTLPLITKADGTKFGKTEAGAIWLDPKRTSVYRFYQFWINTDDRDVIRYLKYFTFLDEPTIKDLDSQPKETRVAHKALAKAVTDLIHGASATTEAIRASEILFGGELKGIAESTFNEILGEVPRVFLDRDLFETHSPLVDTLVLAGLSSSKGQARKDIEGGGIYVSNSREVNSQRQVNLNDFSFGKHLLLRKGKKNYVVVTAK